MNELENRMLIDEEWNEEEYGIPRRLRRRWSFEEEYTDREEQKSYGWE